MSTLREYRIQFPADHDLSALSVRLRGMTTREAIAAARGGDLAILELTMKNILEWSDAGMALGQKDLPDVDMAVMVTVANAYYTQATSAIHTVKSSFDDHPGDPLEVAGDPLEGFPMHPVG